ncbi:MAG TPA: cell division protein FtsL [Candidatus Methylomirabilis sp.]|jgi:cell division protein FtsL|nr:cell division protein FtsL [Candidatus Methylomirabilis sp.]
MARSLGGTLTRSHPVRTRARARRAFLRLDLWRGVLLLGLLCLGILFYVWQHIQVLRLGYALEGLRAERATLLQEQKILTLELARLTDLGRVEAIARARFEMQTPRPGQVIVLPEPAGPGTGSR